MSLPVSKDAYRRARERFFERNGSRWPGTLYDAFDILAPHAIARAEADRILEAAAGIARIYQQAAEILRRLPDQALLEIGVPDHVLPAARCTLPGAGDCAIGRIDMVRTEAGYKLLEFNTDAPGMLVEAFSINAEVCRDAGAEDPNQGGEQLLAATLANAIRAGFRYVGKETGHAVVTSRGKSRRDRDMACYVQGLLREFEVPYAPMERLRLDADGLYDPSGRRIDVLLRGFPLHGIGNEVFQRNRAAVPAEMGGLVLDFVARRRLALINPPFSFLLEAKTLQVVIWNLFASGTYFEEPDRRLIERFMLPSYLDPPPDRSYVAKPAYGGQGDTVRIVAADGRVVQQAACTTHMGQLMVYQNYVELPSEEVMTEDGMRRLHLLTSCFLLSGTPAGICMRAGEAITDESAWVMPVCVG